ncbi:MAG: DVU_1551 family NTP transferase [Oceanidesulfovibrio sp.]
MNASASPDEPPHNTPHVVGVVLAAGFSSRMGALGPKPLLPLGETLVLERAVSSLRNAGINRVIAVLGHRADAIAPVAERAGARILINEDYAAGMFSSVLTAVRELARADHRLDAAAFLPTDCCLVRTATVRELLKIHHDRPEYVVKPVFRGEPGHPVILPAGQFPAVLGHDGREGLRGALAPLPCVNVPVWDRHATWDMDTPEDYARAQRAMARRNAPTPAECRALLEDVLDLPPQAVAHGAAVARVAHLLARRINEWDAEARLDTALVTAAGMLHDIAKGLPDHEREGGRMLRARGLAEVAAVAEAHRDSRLGPEEPLTEREVVYLADKLVYGPRLVSVEERFAEKIESFAADAMEVAAIRGRRRRALAMHQRIAAIIGESPYDLARREVMDDQGRVSWHPDWDALP